MKIKDLVKFILTVLLMGAAIALAAFDPVNDDTDIFLANPTIAAERPNVLIILDNTANWNLPFDNEKNALVQVVNGLSDQYNVGIMIMTDANIKRTGPDSSDGAYVRYHVRQMTLTNKTALATLVGNFDKSADKGDNNTLGLAMYEAYLYFAGKPAVAGDDQYKADHDGRRELSALTGHALLGPTPPVSPAADNLFPTQDASYRSPIVDGCAKNFIIFISNGPSNENATARSFVENKLKVLTGVSTVPVIGLSPSGQQANWADEMAKFMANADVYATAAGVPNSSSVQNVYTYTVEIDPDAGANIINVTTAAAHGLSVNSPVTIAGTLNFNGNYLVNTVVSTTKFTILQTITPNPATEAVGTAAGVNISEISQTSSDMTALLKSMAANGKGKYFGVSSGASGTAIVDALNAIFTEVQAVNSVFASTTLPVSVNVRGTNLNQVYIGVFRPDPLKSPRWLGNLKMYNLGLDTTIAGRPRVFLADAKNGPPPATGAEAENTTTGFISQNAASFWTVGTPPFWGFRDSALNGPGGPSDLPDGDLVEKGGAAQQLRLAFAAAEGSVPLRNLYTCTTGLVGTTAQTCAANSLLSDTPFNTANQAINETTLALTKRFVSPLTAFDTRPVAALSDRRTVVLSNSNPATSVAVSSLSNGATTKTLTGLTTATPKTVTSLTGVTIGTITVNITSIDKVSGVWTVTTDASFSGVSTTAPATVITINCTAGSNGTGANNYTALNGLTNAQRTVTAHNSAPSAAPYTYAIGGPASGNPSCSAGTATGPGPVNSTTATATVTSHGFISGQQVTIAGASPIQFSNTFNITKIDDNKFSYIMSSAAGVATIAGGYTAITAAGNTTTATATTALAHGFTHDTDVVIFGASDPAYNGTKRISCTASDCAGKTAFTYSVGATAIGPNTASPVYAVQGGSTTVTVTTAAPHLFADGDSVLIAGSGISGYNGTFPIACTPTPTCTGATTFTYTAGSVLPASTGTVTASAAGGTVSTVTATAANHGFVATNKVVIESTSGDTVHPGTYTVLAVPAPTTDTFAYTTFRADGITPENRAAPTGNYTVRPELPVLRGIATVTATGGHGVAVNQVVYINGASPLKYNTIEEVSPTVSVTRTLTVTRLIDANTFEYSWSPALGTDVAAPGLGPNTSVGVSMRFKTSTARATSVNHGLADGVSVTIAGATALDSITPDAFNRVGVTITRKSADTFEYPLLTSEGDATGTVTVTPAVASTGGERDLIIKWVRGEDNFENENGPTNTSTSDIRASVHGDVLHSRPAVINYNRHTGSDDDVFVYYGGNDGVFHAVKGGYANPSGFTPSELTPGREAWGFVPSEFFTNFTRMRNNSPSISSSFKKPYFMDGPIGVLTEDKCCLADSSPGENGKLGDTGDRVNLYIANRRGVDSNGRGFLYALDVNNPVAPKFLWKIRNDTQQPAGVFPFAELGQTWSQPTVVPALAGLPVPVLVFGAGYDEKVEDIDPALIDSIASNGDVCLDSTCAGSTRKARSMGRGIFVVNAYTGALIWRALGTGTASGNTKIVSGMNYAIPSDITVIRNETTGVVNRAYVGDTGGNIWRIDFKRDPAAAAVTADPNNLGLTTVTKLASIADESTAAGRRKFLFPPDVVGQVGFDAILIGSGDREHPFDTTVTNRFYMFKDKGDDTAPLTGTAAATCDPTIKEGPLTDSTDTCAPAIDAGATPPESGDIPGMSDLTSNCIQEASKCVAVGGETLAEAQARITARLGTDRGWFITLNSGEKVVGNAISIGGTTFFNTNQPSSTAGGGACGSNLGIARQYQVATADATATTDLNAVGGLTGEDRSLVHAGGGYLPSPVHVVVMLGGQPVEAVISGVQVSTPAGVTLSSRLRKYWYKEVDPR